MGPLTVDITCDLSEGSGLDMGAQAESPCPLASLSKRGCSQGPQDDSGFRSRFVLGSRSLCRLLCPGTDWSASVTREAETHTR